MKKFLVFMMFVGAVATMSECAVTKDYLTIEYIPMENVQVVPGAEEVNLKVTINDERDVKVKEKVSHKVNGYGMHMASILAKNDVAQIVLSAVSQELKNRGFKIGENDVNLEPSIF